MIRCPTHHMSMSTNTESAKFAHVFASPAVLRDAFESKLIELLEQDVLGVKCSSGY